MACLAVVIAGCGARTELDTSTTPGTVVAGPDAQPPGVQRVVCTATSLTTLATITPHGIDDEMPDQIALDDEYVYFHTSTSIRRVPKSGGPTQVLADRLEYDWPNLSAFAIDATTITFVASGSAKLAQVAKSGGPVIEQSALPTAYDDHVSAFSGGFYTWNDVNVDNKSPFGLYALDATGKATAPPIAIDSYLAKVIDQGSFAYAPMVGGLRVLASGQLKTVSPVSLTDLVDDGDVMFGVGGPDANDTANATVWRIDKSTNGATPLLDYGSEVWGVAVDRDDVYFTDRHGGAAVRTSKTGGPTTVLGADPTAQAIGIAVDDACVYWTVYENPSGPGRVLAAPK